MDQAFPLVRMSGLAIEISDHTPLLIDSEENCSFSKKKIRFEKWWVHMTSFGEVVRKTWSNSYPYLSPLDTWQSKVRVFRSLVRGYAANAVVDLNRTKHLI
jgi:hypothetical protein